MIKSASSCGNSIKVPTAARNFSTSIEWFDEIKSTNDYLMAKTPPSAGESRVAVAKHQTAGRGQHGRIWQSSPQSSICLSVAYTFVKKPDNLPAVSMAIGASIASALKARGAKGVALKWPNDLMVKDAKLGGILTENHGNNHHNPTIVIGVGINIDLKRNLPATFDASREREISDLGDCLAQVPTFEEVASLLMDSMHDALREFEALGLAAFRDVWRSFDWLQGKFIRIAVAEQSSVGRCAGIDVDGALLLNTTNGLQRFLSGKVSVEAHANGAQAV